MHPTGPVARRFPLVARSRPVCLPLEARVGRLAELADTAAHRQDPGLASAVFNQVALLASDLGLREYARELCHRHAALCLTGGPLPAMSAIRGLEPLVNLARLQIRAGNHERGHRLLLDLYRAVTTGTATLLGGVNVPARLTETDEQRAEVRAWLWRVVIADGARALTAAGRWGDALRHIEEHRGIGRRILDGRQVAVLARATAGDLAGALGLLEATEPGDPWEDAVTAVLKALCRPGDHRATEEAIGHWHGLADSEGLAVFTTRLGLTVLDASGSGTAAARDLFHELVARTAASADGYALRDLLAHPAVRGALAVSHVRALEGALGGCALDSGDLPTAVRDRLENSLGRARTVLEGGPVTAGGCG